MITKSLLENHLTALHFRRSDTVRVHSSMKTIGPVGGGAGTGLDLLMEYFGDEGLLAFPGRTVYCMVKSFDHSKNVTGRNRNLRDRFGLLGDI